MRYYETLYIVHPDYEEERLKEIQSDVNQWVTKRGATIVNSSIWGKRKLAYPVDKQKYGTYMLLQFSLDTPAIPELNEWMELNERILAHMTVRLDKEPDAKDKEKPAEKVPLGGSSHEAREN